MTIRKKILIAIGSDAMKMVHPILPPAVHIQEQINPSCPLGLANALRRNRIRSAPGHLSRIGSVGGRNPDRNARIEADVVGIFVV